MASVKLNFLDKSEAIFCGDLVDFSSGYKRYFEEIERTKGKKGVYIILSEKQEFIYPKGESKVIYIGKSNNLNLRLNSHKRNLIEVKGKSTSEIRSEWWQSRYLYMREFGAKVYYITATGNTDPINLEMRTMEQFYEKYFSLPVGNGAFSFGK